MNNLSSGQAAAGDHAIDPAPEAIDGEARRCTSELLEVIDALSALVEQETELVSAGKLRAAAALGASKSELAGRFQAGAVRLKANAGAWLPAEPALFAQVRQRHQRFQALLQINQTVLATAHAVSEGLIRGAANELARKSAPQGYGAHGQAVSPPSRTAQPVALSRAY